MSPARKDPTKSSAEVAAMARRRRLDGSSNKMGSLLASQIEREIIEQGWPLGRVLGSETDLTARYGVSRAVFREAVRLLEHHGSAVMRRGPGGGLVVQEPQASAVTSSAAAYLDFMKVTPQQLHEIRTAIELTAVEMATAGLDEDGIALLRSTLALERDALDVADVEHDYVHDRLHIAIAELTKNPVFPLFVTVLTLLTYERSTLDVLPQSNDKVVFSAHEAIVEAMVSGDAALARHRMARHLEALDEWFVGWAP